MWMLYLWWIILFCLVMCSMLVIELCGEDISVGVMWVLLWLVELL